MVFCHLFAEVLRAQPGYEPLLFLQDKTCNVFARATQTTNWQDVGEMERLTAVSRLQLLPSFSLKWNFELWQCALHSAKNYTAQTIDFYGLTLFYLQAK